MVVSREEIDEIRAECFANDVSYRYEVVKNWTPEQIREWFEAGGDGIPLCTMPWLDELQAVNKMLADRLEEARAAAEAHASADNLQVLVNEAVIVPMTAADIQAVRHAIASAITCADRASNRLLCALVLASVAKCHSSDESGCTADILEAHVATLADCCLSAQPAVSVDPGMWDFSLQQPAREPFGGTIAVLMLGYGGSSLASLESYAAVYASRWPHWIRLVHAGPLQLDEIAKVGTEADVQEKAASAAALDELVTALSHVESILVHLMSNQGHMLWCHLLRREGGRLTKRVVGMVCDCAASRNEFFATNAVANTKHRTVLATLGAWDVALSRSARAALESASDAASSAAQGLDTQYTLAASDAAFYHQARADPQVPTLCLTSAEDDIIVEAGVRAYAEQLACAQPSRCAKPMPPDVTPRL